MGPLAQWAPSPPRRWSVRGFEPRTSRMADNYIELVVETMSCSYEKMHLFITDRWTSKLRAFAIKVYYKNIDGFIAAQRQILKDADNVTRMTFCQQFLDVNVNEDIIYNMVMSDEALFHLSGYVIKQNFRYRSLSNPYELHEELLHSVKVTVWCAIATFGIIGPYFFEDDNGTSVTVTSQRYVRMIQELLSPKISNNPFINRHTWFQQDGVTSHTVRRSMDAVTRLFANQIVSRYGDISWLARSPDLTAYDFLLWVYLKSMVFKTPPPQNIEEFKEKIRHEVGEIPVNMLRHVMRNI
ncbi:hypothetical protein ANN_06837 [Periplaneta americana]|uniref:Uncharacterized protein n=1 Tax=Periplaneta americana TaxID=6978 RepID=A0ABQ8TGH2_PERAM|nr:hypothetical protein ANN_06837 [Periplaneta americana]